MPTNMLPKPATPAAAKPAPTMGGKATIGLVGLAVGVVVGYGAGRVSTGTPINPLSDQKGGYEAGYRAAAEKLQAAGALPQTITETTTLSGTVTDVSGDGLTMDVEVAALDPLGLRNLPKSRKVTLAPSAEVTSTTLLTPEEFAAAQSAFEEAMASYKPDPLNPSLPPVPPNPAKQTKTAFSELRVGDHVTVTATTDVLAAASFEAIRVTVLPPPPAIATPEPPVPEAPPAP